MPFKKGDVVYFKDCSPEYATANALVIKYINRRDYELKCDDGSVMECTHTLVSSDGTGWYPTSLLTDVHPSEWD